VKLTPEAIARSALGLLDEVGLDGLTMRLVAGRLGVQAPTLYWHVKSKQQLLDAMADLMFVEANADLEAPGQGVAWSDWLLDLGVRARRVMLRYRDGARVLAGSYTTHPLLARTLELTLRTLGDAGFPLADAARSLPIMLHYTVGFTIEEQARAGTAYGAENPYESGGLGARLDPARYPLTAGAATDLYGTDNDANFEHGLRVIFAGMSAVALPSTVDSKPLRS
jgi:TetR/AcrR family tetracycline transcriptional repressor